MKSFETVTEAVRDLQLRGYTHNFNIANNCLHCDEKKIFMHPEEFEVDEVYRFEGNSDPGDENTLFAISSLKHNLKGILVVAYGAYADVESPEMLSKLGYHH